MAELIAVSHEEGPVDLDFSDVSKIDTTGLQLLVIFVMECAERGRPLNWSGTSSALLDAADLTGLRAALGLAHKS